MKVSNIAVVLSAALCVAALGLHMVTDHESEHKEHLNHIRHGTEQILNYSRQHMAEKGLIKQKYIDVIYYLMVENIQDLGEFWNLSQGDKDMLHREARDAISKIIVIDEDQ